MSNAYDELELRTGVALRAPPPEVVARLAERPLGDAATIHAIPLVLAPAERDAIADAAAQRARALRAFFGELVRGDGGPVPRAVVDRVLADHGVSRGDLQARWSSRDDVCFTYAPDLVKSHGEWCVLEDNFGCLGGLADSYFCVQAYLAAVGLGSEWSGEEPPDLVVYARDFVGEAEPTRVAVEAGCDAWLDGEAIAESTRRAALLARCGFTARDGDVTHVVNFTRSPRAFAGVSMLNGPYVEILGDKRLLPYVDAMIATYLAETPRLRTLPTRALDSIAATDTGVAKRGKGAGGTAVYFLDDAAEREQARRAVDAAGPGSFVLQELAVPGGDDPLASVELRPFVCVTPHRVRACRVPSARRPRTDRRRANLGQGAQYVPVLVPR